MIKLKDLIFEDNGRPKVIIMAGGAGVGKSYVLKQLDLSGLNQYNPDKYVEDPTSSLFNNLGGAAAQTVKDVEQAIENRESFIWDTTASNPEKVRNLLQAGYDVMMIMVYTHPMISFIANFQRERKIPRSSVFATWKSVYTLIDDYQRLLGNNFHLLVNLRGGKYNKEVKAFNKAAEQGPQAVEQYLTKYMESEGGKDEFRSTFSKPFELPDSEQKEFEQILKKSKVPTKDDSAVKELKKDFAKYKEKFYGDENEGIARLNKRYEAIQSRREKAKQREEETIDIIADMITDEGFQNQIKSTSIQSLKSDVKKFL